jgi:hypothetical protein
MLKRFTLALLAAPVLLSAVAGETPVAPNPIKPFDHLGETAAEIGYPVALGLEFTIPKKEDAQAFWASFAASGIRPPEFGISGVEEWEAMGQPNGSCGQAFCDYPPGRGPRSVKWVFRSKPYRIDTPQQMAAEIQKLRTLKIDGVSYIDTKVGSGNGVPPPLAAPR